MSNRWILSVDCLTLATERDHLPFHLFGLFQEENRRQRFCEPDQYPPYSVIEGDTLYEYAAPVADVRDRLDAMGISASLAKRAFADDHSRMLELNNEHSGEHGSTSHRAHFQQLSSVTYESFLREIAAAYRCDKKDVSKATRNFYIIGDPLILVRLCIDALPHSQEIILDYTQLVESEYYEKEQHICSEARQPTVASDDVLTPIVILTEGKTDTRYLLASLQALYPHLRESYSFFDYEGSRASGGTGDLARMVRAFVGARIPIRIVALFDNDAAGHAGLKTLEGLVLPPNFKVLSYPDIDLARNYPTFGPQGESAVDVNGRACGIELYLGSEALTGANGQLFPVIWSNLDAKSHRYQGAFSDKDKSAVGDAFQLALKRQTSPQAARQAFPEMCILWRLIIGAFSD